MCPGAATISWRNDPRYPGAEEAMNAWFVIMIILLGIGALTLHRYDVWRALIWAFRVALVLLWLALSLKYWMIAGVLGPVVLALTLWLWVQAERDVRGRS